MLQWRQRPHHRHGVQAHGDDLAEEADDVFGVVRAVGVVGDAAASVGAHLVLVNHPFEGGHEGPNLERLGFVRKDGSGIHVAFASSASKTDGSPGRE